MATLSTNYPNMLDWVKRRNPDGSIAKIVEQLDQTNEVVKHMVVREANGTWGHRTTVRTGLPTGTWRKFYGGVQASKSRTNQIVATIGMLNNLMEVDKKLADAENDPAGFLASELMAHVQGMTQEIAQTLMLGDEVTEPESFAGFLQHYNDRAAASGENIIGSTTDNSDNASIWLVSWGDDGTFGIFPRGSKSGGLDIGELKTEIIDNIDGSNGRMLAYRQWMEWELGLCVRDWQGNVRVVYDQELLTKNAASGPDLIDLCTQAIEMVPQRIKATCNLKFYGNRRARSFLRRQIANKVASSTLTMETVAGKSQLMLDGIEFCQVDALTNAEAAI